MVVDVVVSFITFVCIQALFQSLSLRLSKSEEGNNELKATIGSLNKEVFKISRTIKVSGQQNERALAFTITN